MSANYKLTGHYFQDGKMGDLEGQFHLDGENLFGDITDKSNPGPKRLIDGKLHVFRGVRLLDFRVRVDNDNVLDFVYSLGKNGRKFEGEYIGNWQPSKKIVGPYRRAYTEMGLEYYIADSLVPKPEDEERVETAIIRLVRL